MKFASVILIVKSPKRSAEFYEGLLGSAPVYVSPTFAQFDIGNGLEFGLWAELDAKPQATGSGGASEICFHVENVDLLFQQAKKMNASVPWPPEELEFGRTMLVSDPDGHRVRFIQEPK